MKKCRSPVLPVSINFKASSVGNLGLVRLSKAILHAFLVSFRGTLGYKALTSRQNMIVSGGNGCSILCNLFKKSVVSLI